MGYSSERKITTVSQTLIGGQAGWMPGQNAAREQERAAQAELDAAASREESARQMSLIRALTLANLGVLREIPIPTRTMGEFSG